MDVEIVVREVSKNFFVVSGIEVGYFSYYLGVISEGIIDILI